MMRNILDDYYNHIASNRFAEGSIVQYKNCLERLYSYLKSRSIDSWDKVTPFHLDKYKSFLSERKGKGETTFKETTQLQHAACIRAFFKYLQEIREINNKSANIVFSNLKLKQEPKQDFLNPEELKRLWDACKDNTLYLAILLIMFSTGLRHSEVINCDVDSVSIERREIKILGKGGIRRRVLLTPECIEALESYLTQRELKVAENEKALFISSRGTRLTYNQLSYIFAKLRKYVPRIYPHLLRHTFATYLLETGSTIKEVQQQLGHKRLTTTSRYVHTIEEETKRKHEKLSAYMK